MGFRDVLRQKRRSVAVIAQVAVAAGLAISFLALGQSIDRRHRPGRRQAPLQHRRRRGSGQAAHGRSAARRSPWPPRRRASRGAQPVETSSVQYNGQAYAAWGLGPHPLYSYRLSAGRWFTAADAAAGTLPPVVLGPVVATPPARGSGRSSPSTWPRDRSGSASSGSTPARTTAATSSTSRCRPWSAWTARPAPPTPCGSATASSSARRHRPGGHRRREPAGRRRVPGHHHQDLRPRGAVHRRRELHPRHRRDPGPRGGGHHAHGPGQRPVMGSSSAPGRSASCAASAPAPATSGGSSPPRRCVLALAGWAVGILLGWLIYQGLLALVRPRRRPQPAAGIPAGHPADHPRRRARAHAHRHPRAAAPRHPDPARHRPALPVTQTGRIMHRQPADSRGEPSQQRTSHMSANRDAWRHEMPGGRGPRGRGEDERNMFAEELIAMRKQRGCGWTQEKPPRRCSSVPLRSRTSSRETGEAAAMPEQCRTYSY